MNLSENEYPSQIAVAPAESPTAQADNPLEQPPADANPLPPLNPPASQGNVRTFLRETLETIALTLIIFVVIRAGVQNFRIEGFSMEPNFHDGQYLLVSKVDYLIHAPERGDVVVFLAPTAKDRDFIKRIIGLPGETVEVREGRVFINNKELLQTYNVNPASYNYGPVVVGEDQLFVLGDNRNNSSDSHSWGMLPRGDLIGKAWISYWPPQQWAVIQTPSFAQGSNSNTAVDPAPAPASTEAPYPYPTN
jgi:signal peptidase I